MAMAMAMMARLMRVERRVCLSPLRHPRPLPTSVHEVYSEQCCAPCPHLAPEVFAHFPSNSCYFVKQLLRF